MHLFQIHMHSDCLHKQTSLNVMVPPAPAENIPVLYLLHGMTDDENGWLRHTLIENYAEEAGLCVVMPNADLSFYADMAFGGDYLSYLAEELPAFIHRYFPVSSEKGRTFVAGNSMGGYGAFLLGLRYPQLYRAAFSLSGPMRIAWIHRILGDRDMALVYGSLSAKEQVQYVKDLSAREGIPELLISSLLESGDIARTFWAMFGTGIRLEDLDGSDLDLMHLAESLDLEKTGQPNLELRAFCGEQDYHYESNLRFAAMAGTLHLPYTLQTEPGIHEWKYWNAQIPRMMQEIHSLL